MESKPPTQDLLSIRKAAERTKTEGCGIGEWTLRRWVAEGKIPFRKAGKKVLLYYPNVMKFLTCGDVPAETRAEAPVQESRIRKIS